MSQDFDPAELQLHGLRLIEASAGTGKTFNLAGLYLRLILEKQVNVRDILVMTFTRAATQELRDRIRARLADAASIAQNPNLADPANPEHAFTQQILDKQDDDRAALAHRLIDAAARIDEATIVTIHGFAQRAAVENAFESALAFDRGDNVDDTGIHREMTADYWRGQVFGGNASNGILTLWRTPDALYEDLAPALKRPHALLAGVNPQRLEWLLGELRVTWPGTAKSLAGILNQAFESGSLLKTEGLCKALEKDEDINATVAALDETISNALADGGAPLLPEWLTLLAAPSSQFRKGAKHQACGEQLTELPALPTLAELQPLSRLFAIRDAIEAVRERTRQHKLNHRQYSYDDLIRALYEALHNPVTGDALADALHARWPYALVDEFQDTDPLQYASLRRIYLDRPRERGALLLIGDPKQAIYGFRGGDIYAYLAAAQAADSARYTLATNYRSTQAVLDGIEALYRLPQADPFIVSEIDFPSVSAGRATGDRQLVTADGEQAALTFWHLRGGETVYKNGNIKNPKKDTDNNRLIENTITRIGQLLDGQSARWEYADGEQETVKARDIAVLVNNRNEATKLQAELARHGIMSVCQHRDSVFESQEADDLRRILRAMAAPDDSSAVRAAQTTALIDKRLGDLIALADDDQTMQTAIEQFHALHEAWARRGVLTALEQLFVTAAPDLLSLADGERRMSNYLQLGELLAGAETECFGMTSVARWLDQHVQAAKDDDTSDPEDTSQLRLESDADLVRISTVHAAKGLEYPIVFMPFALWLGTPSKKHPPDKPPLNYHDKAGQASIDLIGNDKANQTQARTEARSEALRLLYVALTRAKQALFIGWRDPDDYNRSAALDDLLHRDNASEPEPLAALTEQHPGAIKVDELNIDDNPTVGTFRTPLDIGTLINARQDLPTPRPHWSTYSFSRLAHARLESLPADLPEPGAEDENTAIPASLAGEGPGMENDKPPRLDKRLSGTRFGTAVHDILEECLGRKKYGDWPQPGRPCTNEQLKRVADRLRSYGLLGDEDDDPRVEDTANLIAHTLHTPLPEIGPLAQLAANSTRTEMGFMLRLGGNTLGTLVDTLHDAGYLQAPLGGHAAQTLFGLMQGFIDVVTEVGGKYYILDYKTNHLGDTKTAYNENGLRQAIDHAHYDLQYLIYNVALHRHLRRSLGAAYDPAAHLGGVQYLFVRAMDGQTTTGVFTDKPDPALIQRLDTLFDSNVEIIDYH